MSNKNRVDFHIWILIFWYFLFWLIIRLSNTILGKINAKKIVITFTCGGSLMFAENLWKIKSGFFMPIKG